MHYRLLMNFTSFVLFMCHNYPKAINSASLNNSDEIKNIFSHTDDIKSDTDSDRKGMHRNGNFIEGNSIDVKISSLTGTSLHKLQQNLQNDTGNVFESSEFMGRQNKPFHMNVSDNKIKNNFNLSTYKTLQEAKLPETGSNLFLGVPEIIHINGTSSIKPRKGVHFDNLDNKVILHKGIYDENKDSFLSNYSCLWLNKSDCYSTEEAQDLECSCCREGNALAEIFKQRALVDCSKCKSIVSANQVSTNNKVICRNICCKSVFHDINSESVVQDNFAKSKNKLKLKPTVTKVPYDIEVVAELLSRVQQKIYLPVVISLLLTPLVGLSIFIIWQRAKEYWDKRFYKRMDFLIDGMYND